MKKEEFEQKISDEKKESTKKSMVDDTCSMNL